MSGKPVFFQRALFLSWYCSKGDCSFCYMSLQKDRIADPLKARRSFASIFAESLITRAAGWKLEFLSGGYESFSKDELVFIAKIVCQIAGEKQWLNIGVLSEDDLKALKPYAQGYIGTLECANPDIRAKVCPSKQLSDIIDVFEECDRLGIEKGVTVIIGLGETIEDFPYLQDFIKDYGISRITFYSLNPHPGTPFKSSPDISYYASWVAKTRNAFPGLHIIAGAWHDKTDYFAKLLDAGADDITKFPALRLFGSETARALEESLGAAGFSLQGSFSKLSQFDFREAVSGLDIPDKMKGEVLAKVRSYLQAMRAAELF